MTAREDTPLFPEDVISTMLRRLVRAGGLLEPHDHPGAHASLSEILAMRELAETPRASRRTTSPTGSAWRRAP